jgi:hypothetical protein
LDCFARCGPLRRGSLTSVSGPFATEDLGPDGEKLQTIGREFGGKSIPFMHYFKSFVSWDCVLNHKLLCNASKPHVADLLPHAVTTGRKRRCGYQDLVVVKFSAAVNHYTSVNKILSITYSSLFSLLASFKKVSQRLRSM